mgnify:CR=1 FL=1
MAAVLTNRFTGETRVVPTGFSWTTFFFGPFPALFRGDVMWAAVMAGTAFLTMGLAWLVWPFVYNGLHLNRLVAKGFAPGAVAPMVQQMVNVHIGDSATSVTASAEPAVQNPPAE